MLGDGCEAEPDASFGAPASAGATGVVWSSSCPLGPDRSAGSGVVAPQDAERVSRRGAFVEMLVVEPVRGSG